MKFLEKKIYGFTIFEIGVGAFVLMNLKTITSLLGMVTKPVEDAVENIEDNQIKKQIPMTDLTLKLVKEMAPIIKKEIGDEWSITDEMYLSKYIGDKIKTASEWTSLKKYYSLTYQEDLPSKLKSVLTNFFGEGIWEQSQYKKLLKHSFIISDIW